MIPTMTTSAATPPITRGKMVFHVIVDNFHRTFSLDGPPGRPGRRCGPASRLAAIAPHR
jgi:hypothetical protein